MGSALIGVKSALVDSCEASLEQHSVSRAQKLLDDRLRSSPAPQAKVPHGDLKARSEMICLGD